MTSVDLTSKCLDEHAVMALLEGALGPQERALVSAHIDICEDCRSLIAALACSTPWRQDPATNAAENQTLLGGRYRLDRLQGRGSMGSSFAAFDLQAGAPLLVKLLHPEFVAEGEAVARLRAIVARYNDVGTPGMAAPCNVCRIDQSHAITRPLLDGQDLATHVATAPLNIKRIVDILAQLCRALAPAHAQGLAHGDLKPSNIVIDLSDRAVITDAGIAAGLNHPMLRAGLATRSPEQSGGEPPTPRSDVYALGELTRLMLAASGYDIDELPKALRAGIVRSTRTSPKARFATAEDFGLVLDPQLVNRSHPAFNTTVVTRQLEPTRHLARIAIPPGTRIADRFTVEALLGRGGMGIVFKAQDHQTDEPVALKFLHDGGTHLQRFLRESRILAQLGHPGIVSHVDHGMSDERPYLAMEWVRGEDLARCLARERLPIHRATVIVAKIADAIGAAHQLGIVHRDLKPTNVMVLDGEMTQIKLLDFGLARHLDQDAGLTRSEVILGTPGYMAPEQAQGENVPSPAADVFSLGCILFECLSGERAFRGNNALSILAKMLHAPEPDLTDLWPEVPAALKALLRRMLQKDPSHRPADGHAVAKALRSIMRDTLPPASVRDGESGISANAKTLLSVLTLQLSEASSSRTARDHLAIVTRQSATLGGEHYFDKRGNLFIYWSGRDAMSDHCVHAASCAVALLDRLPGARMSLTTGYGELRPDGPVGDPISRGRHLIEETRTREVVIDDVVAHLVAQRFDVTSCDEGFLLRGPRNPLSFRDVLLGVETPFVGRDAVLSSLRAVAQECFAERSVGAVLLSGPAGIGKSRIAREAVAAFRAEWPTMRCWVAQGTPLRAGTSYGLLADALRASMGLTVGEAAETQRDALLTHIERAVTTADVNQVARRLGGVMGLSGIEARESAEMPASTTTTDREVALAFLQYVQGVCSHNPLLILLEDIHWGDLPTLKLIDELLGQQSQLPLLVLAVARPEVRQHFPGLWSDRAMQEIRVGKLRPRDAKQLIGAVLTDVPDTQLDRIVQRGGGNPFFLEELVRVATANDDPAMGDLDSAPDTVLALVQNRIRMLDTNGLRLLRAASVFGRVCWRGGIGALLGTGSDAPEITTWLKNAVRHELLRRDAESGLAGEEQFTFVHELVRDAAYAMLTDEDRTLGHRLAGRWLESMGNKEATVLAEHHERGNDSERAVIWWQRAATEALSGRDIELAKTYARQAMAHPLPAADKGAMLYILGKANFYGAKIREAFKLAFEALELVDEGSATWCACVAMLAETSQVLGDTDTLGEMAQRLLSPTPDTWNDVALATLRGKVVAYLHSARMHRTAAELTRAAITLANREQDDPVTTAFLEHAMRDNEGDLSAKARRCRDAAQAFDEIGERLQAARQRNSLGWTLTQLAAYEEARDIFVEALAIVRPMGSKYGAAIIGHNLGIVQALLGHMDEGVELCEEAISAFAEAGSGWFELWARIYLARIHLMRDRPDEAVQEGREALDLAVRLELDQFVALAVLAASLLATGQTEEALELSRASVAGLDESQASTVHRQSLQEGYRLVRLTQARCLWASGQHQEALAAIQQAVIVVRATADKISEPTYRASFLERDPIVTEILRLGATGFRDV